MDLDIERERKREGGRETDRQREYLLSVCQKDIAAINAGGQTTQMCCPNIWRSGSALVSINKVNLRRARLVLGWVTVSAGSISGAGHLSQYVTSHPGQLSLAIPLWVGTMSTSQMAMMPYGW